MLEILLVLAALSLFLIFAIKPELGLYVLAFLLPFIGWSFNIGPLNIPLVDIIGLLALVAFGARILFGWFFEPNKKRKVSWPLFIPFFIFFSISLISSAASSHPYQSLWYFFRWPAFLYLAYVFLPYNLVTSGKILKRAVIAVALSSILVLISGYLSLYGQDWHDSFFRIRSLGFFGIFPFGENHNLVAEFLNVGIFIILMMRFLIKEQRGKRWLDIFFILMALGIILTFSRAGWITLLLQSLVYGWYYFRSKNYQPASLVISALGILIMLSPLVWKMGQLQQDNASSTENRWLLTEISVQAFNNKPYLGYGSGQYINLVDSNIRFKAKYGEAIDSHGVLQKVLAENGVFGLAAWLFIMAELSKTSFVSLKKYYHKQPWLLPLILAGAGGLFFQFFNTSYYKGKVWLPIALALAAINILDKKYGRKNG